MGQGGGLAETCASRSTMTGRLNLIQLARSSAKPRHSVFAQGEWLGSSGVNERLGEGQVWDVRAGGVVQCPPTAHGRAVVLLGWGGGLKLLERRRWVHEGTRCFKQCGLAQQVPQVSTGQWHSAARSKTLPGYGEHTH